MRVDDLLDRYLRLKPQDAVVRAQLAVVYGKGATTLDEKQRCVALHYRALASDLGEEGRELQAGLAGLLLETGRLLEAESEAQEMLAEDENHPAAHRVFALARYLQWMRGSLASQSAEELGLLASLLAAIDNNPTDVALAEATAGIYREFPDVVAAHRSGMNQLEREQTADALLDAVVNRSPEDARALLARHAHRTRYKIEGAAADLARAMRLAPNDELVVLVAARAHFDEARQLRETSAATGQWRDKLRAAQRLFRRLIEEELGHDSAEPYLRLGDMAVMQDDLDGAIAHWNDGIKLFRSPTVKSVFLSRIADQLLKAGKPDEAKESIDAVDDILANLGGTISRRDHLELMQTQALRRANYRLRIGRFSEATADLQQAIAHQPKVQPDPVISHYAWDLLGRAYAGLEDWSAAATAFDRAANFQPDSVASRMAAAHSWLSAGRAELAIDRAEQILVAHDLPEAWIVLTTAELQLQAVTPSRERNWTRVEESLKGLDRFKTTAGVEAPWRIDFLRADYVALRAQSDNDPDQARTAAGEILRLAEDQHQDRAEFWFQSCLAYERLGLFEDAERAWQQLSRLPAAGADAAVAAARRALIHEDYAKAKQILDEASARLPLTARARIRRELLQVAQAKQDLTAMRTLLTADLAQNPKDVGVLCRLAELELRGGDFAALAAWEDRLTQAGPLGELWSRYYRIIRLYSTAKDAADPVLKEALSEQAQLATLRPNWAESFSLRGAIEQRLGRLEAAVDSYEQAVSLGERRYAIFEQLIACLDSLQRTADVERYLARLESHLPASQRLTEIASNHQLYNDRPEKAIEIAREAVVQRPADVRARLWLGRLLLLRDKLDEAREVFAQATIDHPQDVRVWNGLFSYYLRIGDKPRAEEVLASITKHATLDADERDLVLGQGYLRLGDPARAKQLFLQLSERAPKRADVHLHLARIFLASDRDRAKHHLQRAMQLDSKLSQARWMLAAILAAGGTEAELAQAEELLGGSLVGSAQTIEDRRVRALLLAQHGNADDLVRAVQIFEQIVKDAAATTNDRLLLAQFYEQQARGTVDPEQAAGKLKAASEQLLFVAGRSRAQPSEVAALIGFFLRHDRKADAGVWLGRLEDRLKGMTHDNPAAIAQFIDLRILHGTAIECEPWIVRLEAVDRDSVRPLIARVKYLAALGKSGEIEPTLEAKAKELLVAAKSAVERSRLARAIGDLYLTVNHLVGAERWYRIVVQEDPEQFPVLALALMRQDRAREAILICQMASERDATSRPWVVLASLLLEGGAKPEHMELAEPLLAVAMKKFPEDSDLLYGVGMLRVLEDRYPEAIELLGQVIELAPRHVSALNNLAVLVAETPDRRPEALELVERAIDLRGQQPTLLDTKGTILITSGRSTDALSLLEAAARGTKSDPRHKFHLALAYNDAGTSERARQQFETAMKQNLEKQILTPSDKKQIERLKTDLKADLKTEEL
ncbi:MAG: tetratricopeptide repeat protein [Pirellulaceae bacterium]